MEQEILEEMISYMGDDYDSEAENVLVVCVKRAIRTFKRKRRYPASYSESTIEKDMEDWRDLIFDSALFWATKQGMEFSQSFSENSASRTWDSEKDIYSFHNFVPLSQIC